MSHLWVLLEIVGWLSCRGTQVTLTRLKHVHALLVCCTHKNHLQIICSWIFLFLICDNITLSVLNADMYMYIECLHMSSQKPTLTHICVCICGAIWTVLDIQMFHIRQPGICASPAKCSCIKYVPKVTECCESRKGTESVFEPAGCGVGFCVPKWRNPSAVGDRLQNNFMCSHAWPSCFYLEHSKEEANGWGPGNPSNFCLPQQPCEGTLFIFVTSLQWPRVVIYMSELNPGPKFSGKM
jgi:hypothetical protein